MFTVDSLITESEHSEVAAYTSLSANMEMGIWAFIPIFTEALVGEMNAEWNSLRSRIVR